MQSWTWWLKRSAKQGAPTTFTFQPVQTKSTPSLGIPLALDIAEPDPNVSVENIPLLILSKKSSGGSKFIILTTPTPGAFLIFHCTSQKFVTRSMPNSLNGPTTLTLAPLPPTSVVEGSPLTQQIKIQIANELHQCSWGFRRENEEYAVGKSALIMISEYKSEVKAGLYSIRHFMSNRLLTTLDTTDAIPGSSATSLLGIVHKSSPIEMTVKILGSIRKPQISTQENLLDLEPNQVWKISSPKRERKLQSLSYDISSASGRENKLATTPNTQSRSWSIWRYEHSKGGVFHFIFSISDSMFIAMPATPTSPFDNDLLLAFSKQPSSGGGYSGPSDVWPDQLLFLAETNKTAFEAGFSWLLWDIGLAFSYPTNGTIYTIRLLRVG
jgi:hypothetical protein